MIRKLLIFEIMRFIFNNLNNIKVLDRISIVLTFKKKMFAWYFVFHFPNMTESCINKQISETVLPAALTWHLNLKIGHFLQKCCWFKIDLPFATLSQANSGLTSFVALLSECLHQWTCFVQWFPRNQTFW